MKTKEQIELDVRGEQIIQLTRELECSRVDLRVADSKVVKLRVLLSRMLWTLADIDLAQVKFANAKSQAWTYHYELTGQKEPK